ncbi:hypothetical protein [Candidatus Lokiarchaeum ossiferum]|uniref:hypothetical protein n=1 Tax=Candidatus Lokiarchaeum ossiferum TaxID=2951803 RepID=UPI00352C58F2
MPSGITFIFIFAVLIILAKLIADRIPNKQDELIHHLMDIHHREIEEINQAISEKKFDQASSILETVKKEFRLEDVSLNSTTLVYLSKKTAINVQFLELKDKIETLIEQNRKIEAIQLTRRFKQNLYSKKISQFIDQNLIEVITALHQDLLEEEANKQKEIKSQLKKIPELISYHQYTQATQILDQILQEAISFNFPKIIEEIKANQKVLNDFQALFNAGSSETIDNYMDDLDHDFEYWKQNEKSELGKKV